MNEALAEALAGALRARETEPGHAARADAAAGAPDGKRVTERGGRIAQGADLAGDVRLAVAEARRTPAPF
eukprot:3395169-Pleurochrysis_carterae.AAC.1